MSDKLLYLAALVITVVPASAADTIAERLAQGHLSAAFCSARPAEKPKQVVGIYREIIPVAAPPSSYTTVAFKGGYVGLAGNKTAEGGTTINFSIWGEDAREVEPADQRFGTIKTRKFTHEGTGWAGRLAYPWKVGTRYHIYVQVKHEGGDTIYSAWFGEAEKNEWVLAGRTRKAGIHHLSHAGGFLEHAGKKDAQIRRCTGYGPAWVHDGTRWLPCTKAEVQLKDPGNARFSQRDGTVYIEIGLGLTAGSEKRHSYEMPPPAGKAPRIPEPVAISSPTAP